MVEISPYTTLMVNAMFTGFGAAIGTLLGQKFIERTKLKEIDKLIEQKFVDEAKGLKVMNAKKVDEIMEKVVTEWKERHGEKKLNPITIQTVKEAITLSPHEDGLLRVVDMETKKTHLVPIEHIILKGLKGSEVKTFPVENGNN